MTQNDKDVSRRLQGIYSWYERARKAAQNDDISGLVRERLDSEVREDERKALYGILSSEYSVHKNYKMAEVTLRRLVEEYPKDARGHIQLAEHFLYSDPQSEFSVEASLSALEAARVSGKFYREACGVRARLGLASGRYELLEEAIKDIIAYGVQHGAIDIGVERDFIDRAPKGAVDSSLREAYESLYSSYWRSSHSVP